MLRKSHSYQDLVSKFDWDIPRSYNIAHDICDKWACDNDKVALHYESPCGETTTFTFKRIRQLSNQLSNVLTQFGVTKGDRVAVLLPQRPEVPIAHLASYRIGAIAVPLFTLFGRDALIYRLNDSGASTIITDDFGAELIAGIREELPHLSTVICADGATAGAHDFNGLLSQASDSFESLTLSSEDPAMIIYTSGTTGDPKGALLPHRTMLGHMPGVEFSHDFLGQPRDLIWSPADWAWIGGLVDVLFAAWQVGVPVVAKRFSKFEPDLAADLMLKHSIRNVFMPPTALKMMRMLSRKELSKCDLRSIASGGESLGDELQGWAGDTFGVSINEFYGQTECNMTVSGCSALYKPKIGAIGRAAAGHNVSVIDSEGNEKPFGEKGMIAVKQPNPVTFLCYWNNEQATREKFLGSWLITGDTGYMDDEGFITFVGRDDDVITSAGYRIGPGPIEDCLISHPHVQLAAVIGKADADRSQVVKAFIVLREGVPANDLLKSDLKEWVKARLSRHEYPRQIEFVSDLPKTNTGKIIRRLLRDR